MPLSATPSKFYMYPGNTQALTIIGLFDNVGQAYLNAATLEGSLFDQNGNVVLGPVVMTYVPGSNGDYTGIFGDNTFQPPIGTLYNFVVTGSQVASFIQCEFLVEIRARQA